MSTHWNLAYRPRTVTAIHLRSVRETIASLLAAPRFPHVFLFAGPKGTGKTTTSRIIGAILNEPKNAAAVRSRVFGAEGKKAPALIDAEPSKQADAIFAGESFLVSEQDAASNRGIDDVRSLKERAHIAPIGGLVSVYILDEVHMLSNDAFNALLKLLEEPPPHAVFILATTELHKIPDTIISRCTLIPFHKASSSELQEALEHIVTAEKLQVSPQDLATIAVLADGSFRDAVKYLELQHSLGGASLTDALHIPTTTLCWDLLQAVVDKKEATVLSLLTQARDTGLDEKHLLKMLVTLLHDDVLAHYGLSDGQPHFPERISLFLLHALSDPELLKPAPLPHLRLELVLLELITRAKDKTAAPQSSGRPTLTKTTTHIAKEKATTTQKIANDESALSESDSILPEPTLQSTLGALDVMEDTHQISPSITTAALDVVAPAGSPINDQLGDGTLIVQRWQELITRVSNHNFSLAALLKSATPIEGSPGKTTIRVYYEFHKDQLLQPRWLALLQELLIELAGGYVQLHCVVQSHTDSELIETTATPSLERLAVEALT